MAYLPAACLTADRAGALVSPACQFSFYRNAVVAELVYASVSKTDGGDPVRVRFSPTA